MKLFFTLLFFLFFCNAFATTFYINPKGNDETGNGSINNPWKTLYKATATVKNSGDVIHVSPGTYTEFEQCILAVGVSIEGEGINSVIKSSLTTDWKAIIAAQSPEGTNGNQHISNLKLDGQNLTTFWAIIINGRSNVSIYDCVIVDFKDRGVIFDGRNDNTPAPPANYATGNSFYNNTVTNCAAYNTPNGIYGRGCLNIGGQEGMLIHNNIITQDSRPDGYNGWPIKYSNDGYLKNCKIYDNILTKIPYTGNYGGENGWDFAIEFWNILGGVEIYGNTIRGAVDLANTGKTSYNYSVWFHDNKVYQKKLNRYYESGIIFEATTEGAIVENNIFDNISGGVLFNAQENTVLSDIIIRKNIFSNIGRKMGNGNNGSGINLNCGTLLGNTLHYTVNNLLILNNTIDAAIGNAPYYGIEITGGRWATNIKIQNNTIRNFRVSFFISNPGSVMDSLLIEKNILSGNGNNNNPFFISGGPGNYILKNNSKSTASSGSNPGFNFREQLIRPIYYDIKLITMLELIAMIAFISTLLFCLKENVYVFPMGLISAVIYIFIRFEDDLPGEAFLNLYFVAMSIYGWVIWLKRDKRKHRVVRITASSKNEIFIQLAFFALVFILILFALSYFKKYFSQATIIGADAFAVAAAFTGIWLITKKKVETWYYWIAANIALIYLYFEKHYLFTSCYFSFSLILCLWGLYTWKRKKIVKRKVQTAI